MRVDFVFFDLGKGEVIKHKFYVLLPFLWAVLASVLSDLLRKFVACFSHTANVLFELHDVPDLLRLSRLCEAFLHVFDCLSAEAAIGYVEFVMQHWVAFSIRRSNGSYARVFCGIFDGFMWNGERLTVVIWLVVLGFVECVFVEERFLFDWFEFHG